MGLLLCIARLLKYKSSILILILYYPFYFDEICLANFKGTSFKSLTSGVISVFAGVISFIISSVKRNVSAWSASFGLLFKLSVEAKVFRVFFINRMSFNPHCYLQKMRGKSSEPTSLVGKNPLRNFYHNFRLFIFASVINWLTAWRAWILME